MMKNNNSYKVTFFGRNVAIGYNTPEAKSLLDFLFSDLSGKGDEEPQAYYDVIFAGPKPMVSLWQDEKKLYFGTSKHELAYILTNEVIHQCIVDCRSGHALHAGALSFSNKGILIPGKSGKGKSTLSAWLATKGLNYLTDELVFLTTEEAIIYPFTRPVSLKSPSVSVLRNSIPEFEKKKTLISENGVMIPHRLLNNKFSPCTPPLSLIIFPNFVQDAEIEIIELSAAKCCLKLYECCVNARNIPDHGLKEFSEISRKTKSYQVTYSDFRGLFEPLQSLFNMF